MKRLFRPTDPKETRRCRNTARLFVSSKRARRAQAEVPPRRASYKMERFRPNLPPAHAHPLVKRLFAEMNAQQCSQEMMAARSGVGRNTFKDWRTRTDPTLSNLEACFNVLGFELVARKIKE